MIRRDIRTADGSPCWMLISQVDHAHLAGELAANWGETLPQNDVLLPTIQRHDDGWRKWETTPTIDRATGRPRSFLEMQDTVAHEIWRQSIAGVADLGPLAQYVVAEHFCRLRRGNEESGDTNVRKFLSEFAKRCAAWLAEWQAIDPLRHTLEVASLAVDWLQFFDLLSLWLCMAEPTATRQLETPKGGVLRLSSMGVNGGCESIVVEPWPWLSDWRGLSVGGRVLPAVRFRDDFALRHALETARSTKLSWKLMPQAKPGQTRARE